MSRVGGGKKADAVRQRNSKASETRTHFAVCMMSVRNYYLHAQVFLLPLSFSLRSSSNNLSYFSLLATSVCDTIGLPLLLLLQIVN